MFPREHIRPLSVVALGAVDLIGAKPPAVIQTSPNRVRLVIEAVAGYSHVSWIIGDGPYGGFTAFESTSPVARFFDLRDEYDNLKVPERRVDIYHYFDPEVARAHQTRALHWCQGREGADYPEMELITRHALSRLGFSVSLDSDGTEVCSGIIITGFAAIGLPVVDVPGEIGGPDHLTKSGKLVLGFSKPWGVPWD